MARRLTTRLALAVTGAGLAVSGLVLLLRAVWVVIALPLGAIWASTILGAVLLLVGVLALALSQQNARRPEHTDADLIVTLTNAFLQGLVAGRSAQRR